MADLKYKEAKIVSNVPQERKNFIQVAPTLTKEKTMKQKNTLPTLRKFIFILIILYVIMGCSSTPIDEPIKTNPKTTVKSGPTFTSKIGIEMVLIPPGEFMMGCSEGDPECAKYELPAHKVKITKPFFIGKYEVTQREWKAVMGDNGPFTGCGGEYSYFSECRDDYPANRISWDDVKKFLLKLNTIEGKSYRLPTEAEWEYAARAGTTTKFHEEFSHGITGNCSGRKRGKIGQVGIRKPNAFGLYDMQGNVHEWVEDLYGEYSSFSAIDPTGPVSGEYRVLRGGSYDNNYWGCRLSHRFYDPSFSQASIYGFRVALSQ